jgi:hypothetical protein
LGSYRRTNQTCLTQLSFATISLQRKTPPSLSRLPLPPTVSVLHKPLPVTAGPSGFGNHSPRATSYFARPKMPNRLTQLHNLSTRTLVNDTAEEWPPLSSNRQQRQPVSLAPIILKVTDGKANFRQMDMAELKAIVQDDLTQQQAFLQLSSAANRSLSASLQKSSTGKKASSTTCLSQNHKRIFSTTSSFKGHKSRSLPHVHRWLNNSTNRNRLHHIRQTASLQGHHCSPQLHSLHILPQPIQMLKMLETRTHKESLHQQRHQMQKMWRFS